MISCQEVLEKLAEAVEGSPAPELSLHLACCESCFAQWKALQAIHSLLSGAPFADVPPDLKAKVMASLKREMTLRSLLRIAAIPFLTCSAAGIVIISLLLLALKIWPLLTTVKVLLEMTITWLWHFRELLELLLEIALCLSNLAPYISAALLTFLAVLTYLTRRWIRHEMV